MLKMGKKLLSIIIPCYNEEKTVETIYVAITDTMDMLPQYDYEILFVNDGSKDNTLNKLNGCACEVLFILKKLWQRGGNLCRT